MKKKLLIEREQKYICKREVDRFTKVCISERMLENNCATCPFKFYRDSVEVVLMNDAEVFAVMSTDITFNLTNRYEVVK